MEKNDKDKVEKNMEAALTNSLFGNAVDHQDSSIESLKSEIANKNEAIGVITAKNKDLTLKLYEKTLINQALFQEMDKYREEIRTLKNNHLKEQDTSDKGQHQLNFCSLLNSKDEKINILSNELMSKNEELRDLQVKVIELKSFIQMVDKVQELIKSAKIELFDEQMENQTFRDNMSIILRKNNLMEFEIDELNLRLNEVSFFHKKSISI